VKSYSVMVAMAIVEVTAKRIPIKITFVANGSCILKNLFVGHSHTNS
jgi:hypothetical protein